MFESPTARSLGVVTYNNIAAFWKDDTGQDLIEYTLLMAFVALASAALFKGAGGAIQGIWKTTNSQLTSANSNAS